MKLGTVFMRHGEYKGFIIEDFKDLNDYMSFAEKEIEFGVRSVFNSPVSVDSWDHICRDASMFNGMFHLSRLDCETKGGNPLLNLDTVINRKYRLMMELLFKGEKLVINNVGGFCPIGQDKYTIHEDEDYQPPLNYYIGRQSYTGFQKEPTQWFNIENDPELEQYTRKHLHDIDKKFSHSRNSYHWTKENFISVLTEFKEAGGQGLWLYTTGMHVDQMYMYTDAAIEVGLTKFIFNFNSGESEILLDFIDHYSNNEHIDFKYNFV